MPFPVPVRPTDLDRVVVVAEPRHALNLLRLAVLRNDDVFFVADSMPAEAWLYASRFAVEVAHRAFEPRDLAGAAALLLALPDPEQENTILREARRRKVPVHVVNRPLVSDLSVMGLLEGADRRPAAA
ncbi:NAD(P)-dependent oxidoreductase [Lichenihabitans sp. Uapishka_5]|uniref:NAD(P)-dependent oxidoreductase n=1 Tax=Lichenihabitans sp. Uapishka_5 TaxID=3037302 RepID=UPI0029E7E1BC|nr:NAD(P)-dependent oxidoreductase [Lichenihabitans sp. Uapishka_5]MDX7952753.1 NAD(P)-dependent oxidoreductase [Lichenihabitans sp. Uapishka_5]